MPEDCHRALIDKIGDYESVVLTAFDRTGMPSSVRVRPRLTADGVSVTRPSWADWVEGRAGIAGHYHDRRLWHQRSFNARGRLTRHRGEWVFVPDRVTAGMGYGPFSLLRMMWSGRRRAARYLAARGLARPSVPWAEVDAIKREAFARSPRG